jgi:hypothetical protein
VPARGNKIYFSRKENKESRIKAGFCKKRTLKDVPDVWSNSMYFSNKDNFRIIGL